VARKKPCLRPHQKEARFDWAKKQRGLSAEDFMFTIFSDECYICLNDKSHCVFVTRCPNKEFIQDCLVPTFKQSPVCIMVWACIISGRKGPLLVL
ncbi:hypothetical protein BDQ17DRAFT_1179538, partial [Cyathus striatus]